MERGRFSPLAFAGPAFAGFWDLLGEFSQDDSWPSLGRLQERWLTARGVTSLDGSPLTLVEQRTKRRRGGPRSRDELYDVSVCRGRVPTRPSCWHDFFNVMMFAAFPRSKVALHDRHRSIIERRLPEAVTQLPGARTSEQDALTMLDEGGVILAAAPALEAQLDALLDAGQHDAVSTFVREGHCRPWLFGHAHAEHLATMQLGAVEPLPRAKAVILPVGYGASRPLIDAALEERLREPTFCTGRDGRKALSLALLFLLPLR